MPFGNAFNASCIKKKCRKNLRRNEKKKKSKELSNWKCPSGIRKNINGCHVTVTHETMVNFFYLLLYKLFVKRNQCSGNDIVIRSPPFAILSKVIGIYLVVIIAGCPCCVIIITRARHNCIDNFSICVSSNDKGST